MAVAGLILGIAGVVCGVLGGYLSIIGLPVSIVGLILSAVAGKKQKSGMTTAALVLNIIAVVFTAISFFTCGICVICASAVI